MSPAIPQLPGGSSRVDPPRCSLIVNAADSYTDLFQLLGGYLHQDFGSDAGTADEALRQAVVDTPDERRAAVAAQIESLLAAHRDERSLAIAVNQLCDYYPPGDGLSYRAWLGEVHACVRPGNAAAGEQSGEQIEGK